ncbi:MAG: hypothetical protein HYZ48_05085, partial [Chlamydiales bacterium]|nr:hypothetical protein [Chlamydiales bacterium]
MKIRRSQKSIFWISLILLSFGSFWVYKTVGAFCQMQTDGFSILQISSNRGFNPAWNTRDLSADERDELGTALDQSYRYLACGNQAFAFESEDGKYILKFFKQKLFTPPLHWKLLAFFSPQEGRRAKKIGKKKDKLRRDFESYRIAFDELKEETGLVCVHLNPTDWIGKNVEIFDKLHIRHGIALDHFDFILQKKADLVYPT